MKCRDVTTQAELDEALAAGECLHLIGNGYFVVRDQATVEAGDQATVRAWDQATVRAWGQATVEAGGRATVEAWGQATVRAGDQATVRAGDQATVRAWGQATVEAGDQATVEAGGAVLARLLDEAKLTAESPWVVTTVHGKRAKALGKGTVHAVPDIDTVENFLCWYGLKAKGCKDPTVVLFKAVGDDWKSGHGTSYAPGEKPEAPDWDGGKNRCGGGLHLSPTPSMARRYHTEASRFVACTVRVADLALIFSAGETPDKCKVQRVLKCEACDVDGELLVEAPTP